MALPGWCGFGTAIEQFLQGGDDRQQRVELLQRMHKQWPFFRTLLSNLDMVLAKSDLRIAARYVELVEDKAVAKRIFGLLKAEWQRAHDALSLITGQTEPLQSNPALARSIAHRFPYLDPLNHLQVELLRRYRNRPASPGASGAAGCRPGRCGPVAARHPPVHQRHRSGPEEHGLTGWARKRAWRRRAPRIQGGSDWRFLAALQHPARRLGRIEGQVRTRRHPADAAG